MTGGLGQVSDHVSGGLGDKGVARVFGDTEEVCPPAGVLDGEQHVQALEEHRVNSEEVCCRDAFGLGPQEPGPSRASARGRAQAVVAEDAPDRRRPDPDAELGQLALDAYAAPAAVLPAQPQDQLHQLGAHGRPSRASLPSPGPPFPAPGFAVPTEQRRWRDQESSPAVPREQPAERSQKGAVNGPVPDAAVDLALQDPDVVTEDDQLDVLVSVAASRRHDEGQNPAQPEVQEREGHRSMMTGIGANCQLKDLIEIVAPFTSSRAPGRATTGPRPSVAESVGAGHALMGSSRFLQVVDGPYTLGLFATRVADHLPGARPPRAQSPFLTTNLANGSEREYRSIM